MVLKNGKTVTFVFRPDGSCREVSLAGTFNSWEPSKGRMTRQKDGSYRKRLTLSPGEHRYKFFVDNNWIEDPQAERQQPNEFGTQDSVVVV
jgi:1,4-alpha-glucan branching enzyme